MLNRTEVNDLCYWYYKKFKKNKIGLMMYDIIVFMEIKIMQLLAAIKNGHQAVSN